MHLLQLLVDLVVLLGGGGVNPLTTDIIPDITITYDIGSLESLIKDTYSDKFVVNGDIQLLLKYQQTRNTTEVSVDKLNDIND